MPRPKYRPNKKQVAERLLTTPATPPISDTRLMGMIHDYYTPEATSVILGMSARTLNDLVKEERIRGTYFADRIRFSKADILEFANAYGA